jgi:hypothetical protein
LILNENESKAATKGAMQGVTAVNTVWKKDMIADAVNLVIGLGLFLSPGPWASPLKAR